MLIETDDGKEEYLSTAEIVQKVREMNEYDFIVFMPKYCAQNFGRYAEIS